MRLASRNATMLTGLIVILVLVGSLYLSLTASTGLPGQSFRTASADFDNVGGLREGDDVRSASARVGQVRSIRFEDGKARVVLQLDSGEQLYEDARAAVVSRSALGQNFVMVDPGAPAAGELAEGGQLKDSGIVSPVNLDQVLSALDAPTRKAAAGALREVGSGAAGHSQDLHDLLVVAPDLVADLEQVATALAAESTDLDGMLQQSKVLAGRFDGRSEQVGRLVRSLTTTVEAVAVDDAEPLDATLQEAPSALRSTSTAMREIRGPLVDLDAAMTTLLPGARSLGDATPALRGAMREALAPLAKVPGVADQAVPAVQDLSTLMADARPLAATLQDTFASTKEPTAVLAPYTPEFIRFFERWNSADQNGDKSGNYLRIALIIRPESITGTVPIRDPLVHRRPYPAPGTADSDRATDLIGGQS
ncbi:MAG: hypothetical protein JWN84_3535 [Nocardioides sp.]|nr:hypothetical protein [Nocardioides sp.]